MVFLSMLLTGQVELLTIPRISPSKDKMMCILIYQIRAMVN